MDLWVNSKDLYLGFCGMRFQTTNTSILKLFWMIYMMIFEELRNGGSYIRRIGIKSGKRSKSGQFPEHVPVQVQGCTGTPHQRPTCTGTGPTCTGTDQQNATCTGTGEPKMTRLCSFRVFKLKFIHH